MPSEPDMSAVQRFARDLRRIREDRGVDLATVHTHTQVPLSQIQDFEAGTLYEESTLNAVHLRAFARTYAEAVDLPPDSVLEHLEAAFAGDYQDQLAVEYLDVPPSVSESSSTGEVIEEGEAEGDTRRDDDSISDESHQPAPSETEFEEGAPDEEPPAASSREASPAKRSNIPEVAAAESSHSRKRSPFEDVRALWDGHRRLIIGGIATFLLIGGMGVLIGDHLGEADTAPERPASEASPRAAGPAAPSTPDSLAMDTTEVDGADQPQSTVGLTLGDTMYVTAYATGDVRGLRVQRDNDLRRPYWIEEGDAAVFPFTRRITLQNQLDSLRLSLDGYSYPEERTDEEGRIVITRDTARQFADTLRSGPSTISVSPDTIWGNAFSGDGDTR